MQVTDLSTPQPTPTAHRDDVPALPPTPRPTHQPHAHADHHGLRYSCTGCAYGTRYVPYSDHQAAAAEILRHCGRPDRRIPNEVVHAAKSTLHDTTLLLNRNRLGYARAWRAKHRHASAHATLCAARRAGGAL
jgi:dienelactone hydrolase